MLSIFAVIFLCGLAFGAAITHAYLRYPFRASVAQQQQSHPIEAARQIGLQRLKRQLGLTPAQETVITQELDDYGKFYQNIEDERQDVAEYGRRKILDALTPDQRQKFNEMIGSHSH